MADLFSQPYHHCSFVHGSTPGRLIAGRFPFDGVIIDTASSPSSGRPNTKRAPSSRLSSVQLSTCCTEEFRWDRFGIVRKLFYPNHEPISFDTEDCGMTKPLLSVVIPRLRRCCSHRPMYIRVIVLKKLTLLAERNHKELLKDRLAT